MLRCTHIKWMRYLNSFKEIHFINSNEFFVVYIKPLMNKLAIPLNIKHNFRKFRHRIACGNTSGVTIADRLAL